MPMAATACQPALMRFAAAEADPGRRHHGDAIALDRVAEDGAVG
jgi:hypothetical protein